MDIWDIFSIVISLVMIFLYLSVLSDMKCYRKKLRESKEKNKDKPKIIG